MGIDADANANDALLSLVCDIGDHHRFIDFVLIFTDKECVACIFPTGNISSMRSDSSLIQFGTGYTWYRWHLEFAAFLFVAIMCILPIFSIYPND